MLSLGVTETLDEELIVLVTETVTDSLGLTVFVMELLGLIVLVTDSLGLIDELGETLGETDDEGEAEALEEELGVTLDEIEGVAEAVEVVEATYTTTGSTTAVEAPSFSPSSCSTVTFRTSTRSLIGALPGAASFCMAVRVRLREIPLKPGEVEDDEAPVLLLLPEVW
jgi:hypothetical protein